MKSNLTKHPKRLEHSLWKQKKMSKSETTTTTTVSSSSTTTVPPQYAEAIKAVFNKWGASASLPHHSYFNDFYSHLLRNLLHVLHLTPGSVSCEFSIAPAFINYFNGLHGGAVAAIAERISFACARTVVKKDIPLFLGELGMSYLSAAKQDEVLVVDGSVVRSGRNLTVVSVEFKLKETGKIVYTSRATFYHMSASKL